MRTPDEARAARQAALREARHSLPITGIIIGTLAVIGIGYGGWVKWEEHIRSPGYVAQMFLEAWQAGDYVRMKTYATAPSARWIDEFARQAGDPARKQVIDDFKELTFVIDSVEVKGNTVIATFRRSRRTVLLDTRKYILVPAGDTWRVDMVQSLGQDITPYPY